jgi:uncharacterized protein YqhQ
MANNFRYGGQAVMEGVMMRGQKVMATVVRRPDGTLAKEIKPLHPIYTGRWRRTPLLRGVIALLEALLLGTSALMYSANVALEDIDGDKKKDEGGEGAKKTESSAAVWIIIIISMGLGVGLFFLLPLFLTRLITQFTDSASWATYGWWRSCRISAVFFPIMGPSIKLSMPMRREWN